MLDLDLDLDLFSVFFRAPDGHLIEYVDMLNEEPKPFSWE